MVFRKRGKILKSIILAGGSGTRLWPLSRTKYPKQFIKFNEFKHSLFQQTFLRALKISHIEDVIIVTSEEYPFIVQGQIEELGYKILESNIIVEPKAMNTLSAISAGVYSISSEDIFLVMPSDHLIQDENEFNQIIQESIDLAKEHIITFGIKPTSPKTGFGYIEKDYEILNGYKVKKFKEKPNLKTAQEYIKDGYLWNAGIFMFSGSVFNSELQKHQPDIFNIFSNTPDLNKVYSALKEKVSIDYGLLEVSDKVAVVPLYIIWNDLGSFDALDEISDLADNSNLIKINSTNNYISTSIKKLTALIDIEDLIIVDTEDALLISKKTSSEKVKEVVTELSSRNDLRVDYHLKDYRPWGNYQILDEESSQFKVKRIFVAPHKRLSYQMHHHRSEHWIVVKGTATVTIDDNVFDVLEGESTYIKATQKHRLENKSDDTLEIIEVQLGSYLEEDDIIRFDDDFKRKM